MKPRPAGRRVRHLPGDPYRYRDEGVAVLAAQAEDLHTALRRSPLAARRDELPIRTSAAMPGHLRDQAAAVHLTPYEYKYLSGSR